MGKSTERVMSRYVNTKEQEKRKKMNLNLKKLIERMNGEHQPLSMDDVPRLKQVIEPVTSISQLIVIRCLASEWEEKFLRSLEDMEAEDILFTEKQEAKLQSVAQTLFTRWQDYQMIKKCVLGDDVFLRNIYHHCSNDGNLSKRQREILVYKFSQTVDRDNLRMHNGVVSRAAWGNMALVPQTPIQP